MPDTLASPIKALAEAYPWWGTPTQLGLLERFHQTLKNEEVYWKLYQSPGEARGSLATFRRRYNEARPHWTLVPQGGGDPWTPADVYVHGAAVEIPKWQG